MDMTLNNPCWSKIEAPWKKSAAVAEKVAASA
jgi:nitrogenase molybdenum-iron protein alpha chain